MRRSVLALLLLLSCCGCRKQAEPTEEKPSRPKKKPLTWTTFREIGGGKEPLGIHPLSKADADKGWHWRLGSRDGVVMEAERVMPSGKVYARRSYERAGGTLVSTWSDGRGETKASIELTPDGGLTRTDRSGVVGDEGCHHHKVTFDGKGRFERMECLDDLGHAMADAQGCEVQRRSYDDEGQLETVECVDGTFAEGDHARKSIYDKEGRLSRTSSLDRDGKPMVDLSGCASRKTEWDDKSARTAVQCLDLAGGLVRQTKLELDKNGCDLREEKRDKEGALDPREGVAIRIFRRNALCELTYEEKRDGKGDLTGEVPLREMDLDEHGWVKEERCQNALGSPTNCQFGNGPQGAKARYERDDRGRAKFRWAFTVDGKESLSSPAYAHEWRYAYGPDGRLSDLSYFDEKGRPSTGVGLHRIHFKYDSVGSEISRSFYDRDGSPVSNTTGCHEFRTLFGAKHLMTAKECRDPLGALHKFISCIDGICWKNAARVSIVRNPGETLDVFEDETGVELRRISCSKERCYR